MQWWGVIERVHLTEGAETPLEKLAEKYVSYLLQGLSEVTGASVILSQSTILL